MHEVTTQMVVGQCSSLLQSWLMNKFVSQTDCTCKLLLDESELASADHN